ncbi:MAG: penicillin-binding protein 2 [Patescibacteria group bacterium]|jgi:cell division protein FtsI/penicillin-binding protein 2
MASIIPKRKEPSEIKFKNNRLYTLIAIIFLFFLSMIGKLYSVQITNHDKYLAKADSQHRIFNELKASRGEIYLKQNSSDLYPVALNKDYASIYINPRALSEEDILSILGEVFNVFHRETVIAEVDKFLEEEEKKEIENDLGYIDSLSLGEEDKVIRKQEVLNKYNDLKLNPEWLEFRNMKRDLEIKEREQNIINEYFLKVNVSDKYSRLVRRKIEKDDLIELYFNILKDDFSLSTSSDLLIKNKKILLSDDRDVSNEITGFYYEWESLRYYPEKNFLSNVLGFSNLENVGNYGLEGFFDYELKGDDGFLLGDKGSYRGTKIVIDKREYQAPTEGQSLVLTIDYAVQLYVCQKLEEAYNKHKFESGSITIMEPQTGKIIAMCTWPNFDPNNYQAIEDPNIFDNQVVSYQYEPGSVFKTITMAISIDQGKITPNTYYEDRGQVNIKGWPKPIKNSDFSTKGGGHGWVDMNYVLENSLNTGAIFAANQVGAKVFSEYLQKFGFGEKTGIELSSESPGNIQTLLSDKVKEIDFSTASFGQGIAVTPLQMLASYAVIANKGVLMKPYLVDEIRDEQGELIKKVEPQVVRQVISAETAEAVSAMLVNVVEEGHAKKSKIEGYYIGGKTGTAQIPSPSGAYLANQYIHNFVGYGPINDPKFVMLVKFDKPKTSVFAEGTVVPVFGEITDFLLKYYQIPKERK